MSNSRAIRKRELTALEDIVVIAGPNGCGKPAALDAIRLLKSAYGSYEADEWLRAAPGGHRFHGLATLRG